MTGDPKRPMYEGIGLSAVILAVFVGLALPSIARSFADACQQENTP